MWCAHINKLIGSALGTSRLDIDDVLKGIPAHNLIETHQFSLSEQHFDEQINRLEINFISSTVEYVRTTPLYGITLENTLLLTDSISFEVLSDDDVIQVLNGGLVSSSFYSSYGDFVLDPPRAAIVSRFSIPKVVTGGDDPIESTSHDVFELLNRLNVEESMAIDLLTLTLDGAITPIGSVTKSSDGINLGKQITKSAATRAWAPPSKVLTTEAKDKFHNLWSVVSEGTKKSRHFLTIALRRYAIALSRPSLDDKLIDLMICAEALFLRVEQNELTHKLAYRAALLLGENSIQQREIFKFMGEAYSMRSKVVHGAKSYTQNPKDSEQLSSIITRLSELLRLALLKMLAIALNSQTSSELIDWKDLMFRGATSLDISPPN